MIAVLWVAFGWLVILLAVEFTARLKWPELFDEEFKVLKKNPDLLQEVAQGTLKLNEAVKRTTARPRLSVFSPAPNPPAPVGSMGTKERARCRRHVDSPRARA